jgi:hypothetical protein
MPSGARALAWFIHHRNDLDPSAQRTWSPLSDLCQRWRHYCRALYHALEGGPDCATTALSTLLRVLMSRGLSTTSLSGNR